MSRTTLPLSSFPVIYSDDAELVRDKLFNTYGATGFSADTRNERFATCANHLQLAHMAVSYCNYQSAVSLSFPEAGFVRQIFSIEGTGQFRSGVFAGEITEGYWTPVIPAQTPLELDLGPRYQQLVLRIEMQSLQNHLSLLLGMEVDRKLEFLDGGTRGNPAMSNFRRRMFHFAFDFNTRGPFFSDLAAAEIERTMIMNFLLCHEHNFTHLLLKSPVPAASSTVRVVEDYIEANWDSPLDIATLAEVADVSARTLFRQFGQLRKYSPAEFVKRIRLQRAFEMLAHPNENTSVTQVALRCGFQNSGHFANDYRKAFGERPSDTLTNSLNK